MWQDNDFEEIIVNSDIDARNELSPEVTTYFAETTYDVTDEPMTSTEQPETKSTSSATTGCLYL